MKKNLLLLSILIVVTGLTSCSSFSSKTVEGYWWHSWGHDGLDYLYIKSNGMCDYNFGLGEAKNLAVNIDEKAKTITIYNKCGVEKTLMYESKRDVLIEPEEGYEMERISEDELRANLNLPPLNIEETYNENGKSNDYTTFRHESDIHNYLRSHNFVNRDGDVKITEGSGMEILANGTTLTGAIIVREYNSHQAYFTGYSPINGVTYRFIIDCSSGILSCQNDGTTYYVREKSWY